MLKTLLCAAAVLVAGQSPAAVAPDDDAQKKAAAALEKAEARLAEARAAAEKALADVAKTREAEMATVRDALKSAEVQIPDAAMEAIEKALAAQADGMAVITLDASGLATGSGDGGTSTPLRFRKRVVFGEDGKLQVQEDGDPKAILKLIEEAKAKGGDVEVKEEVRVETKAFTIGPDGGLKELKGGAASLPKVLGLKLDGEAKSPDDLRIFLKEWTKDGQKNFPGTFRFESRPSGGGNGELLGELKKLNERLDAIEERLDRIEGE